MGRPAVSPARIVLAGAAWMAAFGNVPLWRKLAELNLLDTPRGLAFAAALAVLVFALLAGLLGLFAWRRTLKPAATLLLAVTGLAGYFMLSYGVVIDPGMMRNAAQTDWQEASALLSPRLLFWLAAFALPPAWWLWRQPVAWGSAGRQMGRNALLAVVGCALAAGSALASFQTLASVMRNHKEVRYLINPLAALYSAGRVAAAPLQRPATGLVAVGTDATLALPRAARPTVLLLVLGETARSGNFAINGYARPTTPELEREGAVSFRNAWSCGTSTAASVPCMFSSLPRARFDPGAGPQEGLMDVLQHAGLAVLWIDNQSGCKGVCDRIPNVSTAQACAGGACPDTVMLDGLDARIAALDPQRVARGVVVVMHQMGSHGPAYHLRSDAASKRFLPECTSTALADCGQQTLVNAYDNSIVATDRFLGQAIGWLKRRSAQADTALLYVADHGESLGENNLYLHGMPYAVAPDVQKHVPWISWMSDGLQRSSGLSLACLRAARDDAISHDSYFHSVLGLMHVATRVYEPALDVYARCRGPVADVARSRERGTPGPPATASDAARLRSVPPRPA